ncbi:MAG: beta-propeller fold lactonase family protein [Chitinophagales bacterium]|nr:beta-propeller fold lactonase family protein [Chitinophagales bacterium]
MNKQNKFSTFAVIVAVTLALSSCTKNEDLTTNSSYADRSADVTAQQEGYMYTMSNEPTNKILIYKQLSDGTLSSMGSMVTGGMGSGTGLGTQGAVILDDNHQWLYAVNAGDNTISSLQVHADGSLSSAKTVNSEGFLPVSLTVHGNWLYAVNGGTSTIAGFMIGTDGSLTYIHGSNLSLSAPNAEPGEIKFSPDGKVVYVTEKATNTITSYIIDDHGVAGHPKFTPSTGDTPFGFDFSGENYMIVSDAFGGADNQGAATSYAIDNSGTVSTINGPLKNGQTAPCWVVITRNGQYAFTSNTNNNTISVYEVMPDGTIRRQAPRAATTDDAPIDICLSSNNHYLYVVNQIGHTIGEYKVAAGGRLNLIAKISGIPDFTTGLAGF